MLVNFTTLTAYTAALEAAYVKKRVMLLSPPKPPLPFKSNKKGSYKCLTRSQADAEPSTGSTGSCEAMKTTF